MVGAKVVPSRAKVPSVSIVPYKGVGYYIFADKDEIGYVEPVSNVSGHVAHWKAWDSNMSLIKEDDRTGAMFRTRKAAIEALVALSLGHSIPAKGRF